LHTIEAVIETRPFGDTGHESTRILFGAAAIGWTSARRAEATLGTLAGLPINHIDTAATYGDAEVRLAPLLATERDRYFLATKTGDRSGPDARASLERSLERMGVARVDLIQLHNLVEEDEWQQAFSTGGAVEALFGARDEGLCDHVGVTGHGLRIARMHARSIDEAPFASVLLPWNHSLAQIDRYASDFEDLIATCAARGIAIQTIKSVARRRWLDESDNRYSWYEPLDEREALDRAVRFVLADDRLFLNTSSDPRLLELMAESAGNRDVAPPSDDLLAEDRMRLGIEPLFDGADLEII